MNNVDLDDLLKQGIICNKKMIPVYCTTNLSIFKENELNRDIRNSNVDKFVNKLRKSSFMPEPYVVVLPDLRIADGHHRLKAIKEFLAQKDCPVKSVPVWFYVVDNEDFLHNANTGGASWVTRDHLKHYNNLGKIHYVYLCTSLKMINDEQKRLHISSKLRQCELIKILQGLSGSTKQNLEDRQNDFDIANGDLKILVQREFILNILPWYKDIQANAEYQTILNTTSNRAALLTFLVVCNALSSDMEYVTSTILSIKKISLVFSPKVIQTNGGIKEFIFQKLGSRFRRKIFKTIGDLTGLSFKDTDDNELTFNKLLRLYTGLAKSGFFRPEGVWKQEEIMNQQQ
ncbi:hypothetical protein [Succinimonas sp.]|uniref:hypothetical protein n=1 Tax=Succinimonas sp. TaxID=1936151 RepID=UPI00386CCADD